MSETVHYRGSKCGHEIELTFDDEREPWESKTTACNQCGRTQEFTMIGHADDSDIWPGTDSEDEQNDSEDTQESLSGNGGGTVDTAHDEPEPTDASSDATQADVGTTDGNELVSAGEKAEVSTPDVNHVAQDGYEHLQSQPDPVEEYDIDEPDVGELTEDDIRHSILPEDYRELQSVAQAFDITSNRKAETLRDELVSEDWDEVVWTVVGLQTTGEGSSGTEDERTEHSECGCS